MHPHTRALVAAATFAVTTGRKVAGLYDHSAGRDVRIAAECRDQQLQGFDGERGVKFGGTLPEIYDAGDRTFIAFALEGGKAQGYDRGTSTAYVAQVTEGMVQVYVHGEDVWYAYDVQDADAAQSYHRGDAAKL